LASFKKLQSGIWQVQIARKGIRRSASFPSKQEARDWAAREEFLILNAKPAGETATLGDVLRRYAVEVSPTKRGERWEILRLNSMRKLPMAAKTMRELTAGDFALWRDARMAQVSNGTILREINLLSAVMTAARKEWGLIDFSPLTDLRRPTTPRPRDRRVLQSEFDALSLSAGADLTTATARAYHALLLASETGLRAGEIVGLTWENVDLSRRVAHLPMTKNGTARDVPLSREAVRLLEMLPRLDPVFGLNSQMLDALWRKVRDRAAVTGLTFHDSRHEAVSRLALKVDVLTLARIIGHRDIRMLQIYYNPTAQEIADRLG
jgi:integrase